MRTTIHSYLLAYRHLTGKLKVSAIAALLPRIPPEGVFIDIGAHGGSWTVPLSRHLTKGRTYAVDAMPYYSAVLIRLLKLLRIKNSQVFNYAVSDFEGSLKLQWKDCAGKRLTGKTHILAPNEQSIDSISVACTTLDSFVSKQNLNRIDLIKVDVEGAELSVFRGSARVLETYRPMIYTELEQKWLMRYSASTDDVFSFLSSFNYDSYLIANGSIVPIRQFDYSGTGDVLFLPK